MYNNRKKKIKLNEKNSSIWIRALIPKSKWDEKDEFLDLVYWSRQIIGLAAGVVWGVMPITGIFGMLLFAFLNTALLYFYFYDYQQLDDDDYGGFWELNKEGFATSFSSFLVMWIIFYTGLHFD